jgi:hypothetical protein
LNVCQGINLEEEEKTLSLLYLIINKTRISCEKPKQKVYSGGLHNIDKYLTYRTKVYYYCFIFIIVSGIKDHRRRRRRR